jgi:hypothetical protein
MRSGLSHGASSGSASGGQASCSSCVPSLEMFSVGARSAGGFSRNCPAAPIQQFLYRNTDRALYMYYWHYTLRPPQQENIDDLQRLYQRMQRRCSSMTIEVSTYDISPEARERTVAFVEAVDRALQKDLPPLAVRGSNRTPVRRLEAH